eukprot:CAMPEP_0203908954 /NCGR_PEP_ID=MMETSP0359-20131031/50305_1 /ASSEMBLY_ACC=CAM_ASM_000338 /TAXON_ID=268821 /ORGANISM="Scrippsiella Hangoei, Strain SHTV-5" /LENGTH=138 /DNA_ID=CAMNT_0050834071 /DNA_START=27 /DNA_END=439 /DNA_ORIENTATION=-
MTERGVDKDSFTFAAMVGSLRSGGEWARCLQLLREMSDDGQVEKIVIAYSSAICACERASEWTKVLQLLQDMVDRQVEEARCTTTYTPAARACAHSGEWSKSLHLLTEMADVDVNVGVLGYGALVASCERGGVQSRLG